MVTGRLCVYVYVRTYMHARAEGGKWGEGGERVSGERGTGKDRGSNRLVGGREEREREGRSGVRAGQLPVRFSRALWKGESSEERRTRGRTGARRRRRWRRTITERRNRRE